MFLITVKEVFRRRLQQLDQRLAGSTVNGIAPSSQGNFRTHVTAYVKFCLFYGLDLFPADVLQERRYIQYLSEYHKSVDSSKNYVSGMRSLHEMFEFTPPPADNYLYKLTVKGIRREKGHVVRQACAMTPDVLVAMSAVVDVSQGDQLAAWVAILCGFYLLFRKSNLVPDTCTGFNPCHQMARQNLVRLKDCYIARVYWSKTIQFNDKCLEIPLLPNPDRRLCPVFWLDYYLSRVPVGPTDPAFAIRRPEGLVSLSYAQLTEWLKTWVADVGMDKELYSSHSLRRGGAQWSAHCGIPHHVIKLLGDWKSQAYEHYLSMTLQERYDAMLVFTMNMH